MAVSASHAALPYPIKGARYSILVPYLDADGDPTAPTTPDTEISKDNGAAADCAEEVSATSGMDGMSLITLSGAETDCSCLALNAKVASGPKATLGTWYPRVLPVAFSGTASAGANGSITLATDIPAIADLLIGCIVKTTGGTGGGGTGGANNQARVITAFSTGRVATVVPNWETNPSSDTTYEILLTEFAFLRLADIVAYQRAKADSTNPVPADTVKVGGTTQTAKDLGAINVTNLNTLSGHDPGETIAGATDVMSANVTQVEGTDATDYFATLDDAVLTAIAALNNLSQANIRTAVGLASANLDTQLDALPTNSELSTALAAADDAVLAAIAALNNLSQANIRTAVGLGSANLDTQLAAIQADLPTRITKNTALSAFEFTMVDSSDHVTGKTGLTITATRSLDGAAFGACANSASEVGNGVYKIDLAAGDLNGNTVTLKFAGASADTRIIHIITQPT